MPGRKAARLLRCTCLAAIAGDWGWQGPPRPQEKKIKIGVIYDLTRPARGRRFGAAIYRRQDQLDSSTPKPGVKRVQGRSRPMPDAQSKLMSPSTSRPLIEQEKVNMLLASFSSAQCRAGVPGRAVVISSRISCGSPPAFLPRCWPTKNFKYVFRPQASGRSVRPDDDGISIAQNSKEKFGRGAEGSARRHHPRDGAYGGGGGWGGWGGGGGGEGGGREGGGGGGGGGRRSGGGVDVSKGNEAGAKKAGFNVVMKEGYSATAHRSLRARDKTEAARGPT